jgi:hypothetical protein
VQSKIVLASIEKQSALEIQDSILKKSEIEEVSVAQDPGNSYPQRQ